MKTQPSTQNPAAQPLASCAGPAPRQPSTLELLLSWASPAVLAKVRARLEIDDEKLVLLIVKQLNPAEVLREGEEAVLRGVSEKTLRAMKQRGDAPRVL